MKLVIPPECQLGAMRFNICRNDDLLHRLDLSGQINDKDQKIRIAHRKPDQEFLILMHEALHNIADEFGISFEGKQEASILALSNGIVIFLNSLGIEPDFSQIPEETL